MNKNTSGSRQAALVLPTLVFLATLAGNVDAATTAIIVRHAEKATAPATDPPLTAAGSARAATLARLLGQANVVGGVDAVYASDYQRTRQTAAPLAELLDLPVRTYDPRDSEAIAAHVLARHADQTVLLVGHSNTVGSLVRAFGGTDAPPIDDGEYDNLYIVVIATQADGTPAGDVATLRLRYGARAARGASDAGTPR